MGPPQPVAFRIFDEDADGAVTAADLLRYLSATNSRGLDSNALLQIANSVIAAHDRDGDGRLCYQEFCALLRTCEGLAGFGMSSVRTAEDGAAHADAASLVGTAAP